MIKYTVISLPHNSPYSMRPHFRLLRADLSRPHGVSWYRSDAIVAREVLCSASTRSSAMSTTQTCRTPQLLAWLRFARAHPLRGDSHSARSQRRCGWPRCWRAEFWGRWAEERHSTATCSARARRWKGLSLIASGGSETLLLLLVQLPVHHERRFLRACTCTPGRSSTT